MTNKNKDRPKCQYVVALMFNKDNSKVLLCEKIKGWQKDLLNGLGGHVEAGENAISALIREVDEETHGVIKSNKDEWKFLSYEVGVEQGWMVYIYYANFTDELLKSVADKERTDVGEPFHLLDVKDIRISCLVRGVEHYISRVVYPNESRRVW